MSKTWRRESDSPKRPTLAKEQEDEDIDPRAYNVFQRLSPERYPLSVEKAVPEQS